MFWHGKRKAQGKTKKSNKRQKKVDVKLNCRPLSEPPLEGTELGRSFILPIRHITQLEWGAHQKNLTLEPKQPSFKKRIRRSFSQAKYVLYDTSPEGNIVGLPAYYGLKYFGLPAIDNRFVGQPLPIDLNWDMKLADADWGPSDQKTVAGQIDTFLASTAGKVHGGIVVQPTGAGKSVLQRYLLYNIRKKALVVLPFSTLLEQTVDDLKETWPSLRIEMVRGALTPSSRKSFQDADIVVTMLQSLAYCSYPEEIFASFGLVIFDELHKAASKYLRQAMYTVRRVKLIWGFTATLEREDGMHALFDALIGPVVVYDNRPLKVAKFVQVQPICFKGGIQETLYKKVAGVETMDSLGMQRKLADDPKRTEVLLAIVSQCLQAKRRTLIFCPSVDYGTYLADLIKQRWPQSQVAHVDQSSSKEERKKARMEPQDILIATAGLLGHGLNILWLDTIIEAMPFKAKVVANQSSGRFRYPKECENCKKPVFRNNKKMQLIYLFDNFGPFRRWFLTCSSIYTAKGFKLRPELQVSETADIKLSFPDISEAEGACVCVQ